MLRTDRQVDRFAISISRVSMLTRDNKLKHGCQQEFFSRAKVTPPVPISLFPVLSFPFPPPLSMLHSPLCQAAT